MTLTSKGTINYTSKYISGLANNFTDEYGGKGTNLLHMASLGFRVPEFVILPARHTHSVKTGGDLFLSKAQENIQSPIRFQFPDMPLLSVRSGAKVSMPGMMDTILNIGMNRDRVDELAIQYDGDKVFALDCYRRLIAMYGSTVHGVDSKLFSERTNLLSAFWGGEIPEHEMWLTVDHHEQTYFDHVGEEFPQDVTTQINNAVSAVYRSWWSERAVEYRNIEGISHDLGTAVIIQKMVFGNLPNSATGVVFTHDPNSGERGMVGEYLSGAQGEDVVAGTHRPKPIESMKQDFSAPLHQLESNMQSLLDDGLDSPNAYDIEFTIENGQLWMLQYRVAKMSTPARIRSTIDFITTSRLSEVEGTRRIMDITGQSSHDSEIGGSLIGQGVGATSGVISGVVATTPEQAEECIGNDTPFIYVRYSTDVDDVKYISKAEGILTASGGTMSHAALVARSWNKVCVVGCTDLIIYSHKVELNGTTIQAGETIIINGSNGEIYV